MSNATLLVKGGGYRTCYNSTARGLYETIAPLPKFIDGAHSYGHLAAIGVFSPAILSAQQDYLNGLEVQPKEGDKIYLAYVPERHRILSYYAKTEGVAYSNQAPSLRNNSKGFAVNLIADVVDPSKFTDQQKDVTPIDTLELEGAAKGIVVNDDVEHEQLLTKWLPAGQGVLFGFEIASLPTDKQVTLGDVTSSVSIYVATISYPISFTG